MAALRHGIRTVIIPRDNERDLEEIDQTVRRQLNFIIADNVDTVLEAALNRQTEAVTTVVGQLNPEIGTTAPQSGLRQ